MNEIKLLVFDIDGTLIKNKSEYIDASTINALKTASENGYLEIIATGRCSYFIPPIVKDTLKNADYYVTINGTLITDGNFKTLYKQPLELQNIYHALELAYKYHVALAFKFEEAVVVYHMYHEFVEVYTHGVEHPDILIDNTQLHNYHLTHNLPLGIFIIGDNAVLKKLSQDMPEVNWVYAYDHALEAYRHGVSKAQGLAYILNRLKLTKEQMMVFGDGENDIEMLEMAKIGVAMGNASDSVKAHADFVTKDCDQGGIAYALEHFQII